MVVTPATRDVDIQLGVTNTIFSVSRHKKVLSASSAKNARLAAVPIMALLMATSPAWSQKFYDDQPDPTALLGLINKATEKICPLGFTMGFELQADVICKGKSCQTTLTLERSIPKGDVFVTAEFEVLFSKADTIANTHQEDSNVPLPHSGLTAKLTRKEIPLLGVDSGAKEVADCFLKLGATLKSELAPDLSQTKPTALQADALSTKTDRILQLEHASYFRQGPAAIKLPESGTLVVEITPSQRYKFAKLQDDSTLISKVDKTLAESLRKLRGMPHGKNSGVSIVASEYSGTTLQKVEQMSRPLTMVIEIDGAVAIPLTPIKQAINPMRTTRWIWRLEAKDDAEFVRVRIHAVESGLDSSRIAPFYIDWFEIPVLNPWHLRAYKFLQSNWQWAIGSLLTPLLALAWRHYRTHSKVIPHQPFKRKLAARQRRE